MRRTLLIIAAVLAVAGGVSAADITDSDFENEILFMIEEEKMAGDLYSTLAAEWNLRVFANIAQAENTHQTRMEALADDWNLDYDQTPVGVFSNPDIQALYDELLATGMSGVTGALEVGRTVEITDIADIDSILAENPPADLELVLRALRAGSENHLAAFERQLSR